MTLSPSIRVKICGLSTAEALDAALASGADLIGLVHFARSPRHVDLETGAALSRRAKGRAERVALLVDPDDALLDAVVEALDPDWIQLHGREAPERAAAVRSRTGRRILKAIGVATLADLAQVADYATAADGVLLDAKPAPGALPGGNGHAFDWRLIREAGLAPTFMLSGGLTPSTVAEAVAATDAPAVDVSSGVERAPGHKDPDLIRAFVTAVRGASARPGN
ncbi:phosphoribosylanthranilate isomerase [Methylobacterium sp. ID0610]|uniref:phosphoribosylanthranilate isomerase n=1 Tax=Methylobacterium carpenticola TaxID=3344827 RepID=UPI003686C601